MHVRGFSFGRVKSERKSWMNTNKKRKEKENGERDRKNVRKKLHLSGDYNTIWSLKFADWRLKLFIYHNYYIMPIMNVKLYARRLFSSRMYFMLFFSHLKFYFVPCFSPCLMQNDRQLAIIDDEYRWYENKALGILVHFWNMLIGQKIF